MKSFFVVALLCLGAFFVDSLPSDQRNPSGRTTLKRPAETACNMYSTLGEDRILGGENAEADKFPWMAALGYLSDDYKIRFSCRGTIISDYFILTAAHCVKSENLPVVVRLGSVSLNDEDEKDEDGKSKLANHPIIQIISHPNYMNSQKKNDIALIRVRQRIKFSNSIRPACLNTDLADLSNENPDVKLITISSDSPLYLNTVPLAECNTTLLTHRQRANYRAIRNGISDSQYCTRDSDPNERQDQCRGDSGGPLQISPNDSRVAKVVGVTSFSISCGSTYPHIYTRVAYYLDWIEEIVWQNNLIVANSDK